MLELFRGAAKGWIAKIFLVLLVLSFAVWGIADIFTGFGRGGALASVGGKEVSAEEFSRAFQQTLQAYSRQTGETVTPEKARGLGIDRRVLGDLLRVAALEAQADRLKLAVSDRQIAEEIRRNPAFLNSQGQFDVERFRTVLAQNGLSEAGFVASQRSERLRSAISGLPDAIYAPPESQVGALFRHQNEQRDARYFVVSADPSEVPPPSDADIKAFHEANPKTYTAPEYRSIAMFKAEPRDVVGRVSATDTEVSGFYDKYKSDYFTPERRTIMQIVFKSAEEAKKARERIAAGTDFLDIAKEMKLTAQDVTLGTLAKSEIIDPKIADAAFVLSEGQVSDVVQGSLSVVVLKVLTVTAEHQQTLDEAKGAITERIKLEKAREELQSIYDAVEDARAAQTPFEEIAKRANIPFLLIPAVDSGGFDRDGKPVEMPLRDEIVKLAFASDSGVENDAFATKSDGFAWYEVREVIPSALRPLETVKDKVKADLIARKVRELAGGKAKKLVERAKSGSAFEELAREAGAEIKTVQGLKRNETGADFNAEAVAAIFTIPEKGFIGASEGDGKSARVMQATAVLSPKFDPRSADAETIRKPLKDGGAADLLQAYETALQADLGVTVNETLWRQITGAP